MLPTVFSLARGWISPCEGTGVCARKRSMMPRKNGLMPLEVTSTVASPSRAAASNFSRTSVEAAKMLEQYPFRLNHCASLTFFLSMIFSENRFPLFGIML